MAVSQKEISQNLAHLAAIIHAQMDEHKHVPHIKTLIVEMHKPIGQNTAIVEIQASATSIPMFSISPRCSPTCKMGQDEAGSQIGGVAGTPTLLSDEGFDAIG